MARWSSFGCSIEAWPNNSRRTCRAPDNPLNLPADFRVDGLAVEADTRRRDDVATIGLAGPVLELLRIRRRPG
jgi:hypothetical protein